MTIKEAAIENIRDMKEILDGLQIKFWLDGGTALGAYRDKDFCEGDEDDIDLCTWDSHNKLRDKIIAKAKEKGFDIYHEWELEIAFTRNGNKIDLFFNRMNLQHAYTHLYSGDVIAKFVVIPRHFYMNLECIKFYDMDFLVPAPIEDYLALKYGDWKTKIHRKDYSCINAEQNKLVRDTYDV